MATLEFFTIFTSKEIEIYGNEDLDEMEEQILFYHPNHHQAERRVQVIGLAQTLLSFTRIFDSSDDREITVWRSGLGMTALTSCEGSDYWFLLKINLDQEKLEEEAFITKILDDAYNRFKMFHHSFFRLRVDCKNKQDFKSRLMSHFSTYMQVIESRLLYPFLDMVCDGIKSAPFTSPIYRQVVTACTRLCSEIALPQIKLMLLWKETLFWSSLDIHQDTKLLFDYLTDPTTGLAYDGILNQTKDKGEPAIVGRAYQSLHGNNLKKKKSKNTSLEALFRKPVQQTYSGFLVGPDLNNSDYTMMQNDQQKYQTQNTVVYLTDFKPHVFIVYQWEDDYTLCILSPVLDHPDLSSLHWHSFLKSSISSTLESIRDLIGQRRDARTENLQNLALHFLMVNQTTLIAQQFLLIDKPNGIMRMEFLESLSVIRSSLTRREHSSYETMQEILVEGSVKGQRIYISGLASANKIAILAFNAKDDTIRLSKVQEEIKFIKAAMLDRHHSS